MVAVSGAMSATFLGAAIVVWATDTERLTRVTIWVAVAAVFGLRMVAVPLTLNAPYARGD